MDPPRPQPFQWGLVRDAMKADGVLEA